MWTPTNGTIAAANTAQNGFAPGHSFMRAVIQAGAADIRFAIGRAANATDEVVKAGTNTTVDLFGQQLSLFSATLGAAYTLRPSF